MRSFLESPKFPIDIVNSASAKEKQGGGRPPHWEMIFWWTRKPLAGARAIVLASLLPENTNEKEFIEWIYPSIKLHRGIFKIKKGKKEKELPVAIIKGEKYGIDFTVTPYRNNPKLPSEVREKIKEIKLLDPFAGFGTIPLEAVRLGVGEVVAVEFLPTAYIFLKAVLEYPKEFSNKKIRISGREVKEFGLESSVKELTKAKKISTEGIYEIPRLIYDVAKWGKWITEKLREDQDIKELYDEDVAVYIGTWEVKCPNTLCNKYTPLVGNWWLARVKGKKHVYMKPATIKVKDPKTGKEMEKPLVVNGRLVIEVIEGKNEGAPSPNVRGRPETAECLVCGSRITYIDPRTGKIYSSKKDAPVPIRKALEFYPKYAIRDWNHKLEQYLEGRITLEELKNALARPRLLVKAMIKSKDLEFEPATEQDNEKLWKALEKLKQIWGDPDIPIEQTEPYCSSTYHTIVWGFDKFYKLFNPRQLLTLVKLVKLIRETGKKIEEEKLREGWNKEKAKEYAEAVTTYLAIALTNFVRHNALVNHWEGASWQPVRHALAMRGIAMQWNWCDVNPYYEESLVSYQYFNSKNIDGLSYLVSVVSGSPSRVRVVLDDATVLSKLGNEKFDVIVTDPPYRDDVPYAELSDFYYVWLKRALSDDNLTPRFHTDALIYNTQWESLSSKEISYNEGRIKYFKIKSAADYYRWLLSRAFKKMASVVKDNGLIATYFAHSSPEAWIELVEAGWRRAGLKMTRAWSVATESAQRVTAQGKVVLESSIIVVWKKRNEDRVASIDEVRERAKLKAREALEIAENMGLKGMDLFLAVMSACLSEFTSYSRITKFAGELSSEEIVAESYRIAIETLVGEESRYIKSPEALAYITIRRLFARVPDWDWTLDSQDLITLGYGLYGTSERKQLKRLHEILVRNRIVGIPKEEKKGAKVAKPKSFKFLSPRDARPDSIKEVLSLRKIDPLELSVREGSVSKPLSSSIDVLHLLEYAVHRGVDYFKDMYSRLMVKYPSLTEEAIYIAKTLSRIPGDPESNLCRDIKKYLYEG